MNWNIGQCLFITFVVFAWNMSCFDKNVCTLDIYWIFAQVVMPGVVIIGESAALKKCPPTLTSPEPLTGPKSNINAALAVNITLSFNKNHKVLLDIMTQCITDHCGTTGDTS